MQHSTCVAMTALLFVAIGSCGASQEPIRERLGTVDDGGSKESASQGAGSHGPGSEDAASQSAMDDAAKRLAREAEFWQAFEIDGDWAEFHPTLSELAASADGVLVVRLSGIALRPAIQGDAPEDVVSEAQLRADVIAKVQGSVDAKTIELALIIPNVRNHAQAQTLVDEIAPLLPIEPVVLIVRERAPQLYRPVNGYGLWAATTRSAVDAPLNPESPDQGLFGPALAHISSLEALTDELRPD